MRSMRFPIHSQSVVAVAIGAIALAGCSLGTPGVAAQVGKREISTEQLGAAVAGIKSGNAEYGRSPNLEQLTLTFLILAPIVEKIASAAGLGVSDDDAKSALAQDRTPDPQAVRVLKTFIAIQKISQAQGEQGVAQIQSALRAAKPKVNPRFGKFDAKSIAVVQDPPNWLQPKPSPGPAEQQVPAEQVPPGQAPSGQVPQ